MAAKPRQTLFYGTEIILGCIAQKSQEMQVQQKSQLCQQAINQPERQQHIRFNNFLNNI